MNRKELAELREEIRLVEAAYREAATGLEKYFAAMDHATLVHCYNTWKPFWRRRIKHLGEKP